MAIRLVDRGAEFRERGAFFAFVMRVLAPGPVRRVEEVRAESPGDQHAVEFQLADGDDRAGQAGRLLFGDHREPGRGEFGLDDPGEGFEAVQRRGWGWSCVVSRSFQYGGLRRRRRSVWGRCEGFQPFLAGFPAELLTWGQIWCFASCAGSAYAGLWRTGEGEGLTPVTCSNGQWQGCAGGAGVTFVLLTGISVARPWSRRAG